MANQHVQDVQNATRNFCDPTGALKGEFGLWIENLEGDTATPYKMLYEAAEWSALLHYFSDRKHNTLDRPIEPDGSNIQHLGLLRDTFDWYTKWMSLLHQKKILRIMYEDKEVLLYYWETDWQRLKRFKPTMCEAKIDMLEGLEEEIYGSPVEHLAVIFEQRQELTWVWHWRQSVLETLFEMQNAAERFPGTHADKEMAVRRAFMKMPPSTWLLVRLIDAEQTFESELQYWHVEDEHIKKRLFVLDDKNFARLMPCEEAIPTWDEYAPSVTNICRDIQQRARRNYDYRLLRDWGRGRAFKKMDLVVYTEGKEELKKAVRDVRELFNSTGKLGYDLFGVHPIDMKAVQEESDQICLVCFENWEDGSLRVTTHCNHHFHPDCIFRHWDVTHKFNFDCPKCRQPGRALLSRIQIDEWRIRKENNDDEWRFSDEGLAEFNELIEEAENWGIDGDYKDMPDDLWEAWVKHLRRKMVDEQLEGDPVELTGEVPDPTADWPRPEPEDSRAAQDEEDEEL